MPHDSSNQHARMFPVYKKNVDGLEVCLNRWELNCTMEDLDRKYWATKHLEYFYRVNY